MENGNISDRRGFLLKSITIVGAGLLGGSLPVLLSSCSSGSNPASSNPTPTNIDITNYPELQTVNGFKKVSVSGKNSDYPFIIIRKSTTEFTVLSSMCQHQGCEVNNPDIASKTILCHCHGSRYNLDGSLINGPSQQPLQVFPSTFNSTTNVITFNS